MSALQPVAEQFNYVTLVADAIHNPAEPRHFMSVKPSGTEVVVEHSGIELARSKRALRLSEVGKAIYRPVFYIPRRDIDAILRRSARSTVCPLKGRTIYYDLVAGAKTIATDIAWEYIEPFEFADILRGHVAFDQNQVAITEFAAAKGQAL